jgi:hypothetical protein
VCLVVRDHDQPARERVDRDDPLRAMLGEDAAGLEYELHQGDRAPAEEGDLAVTFDRGMRLGAELLRSPSQVQDLGRCAEAFLGVGTETVGAAHAASARTYMAAVQRRSGWTPHDSTPVDPVSIA